MSQKSTLYLLDIFSIGYLKIETIFETFENQEEICLKKKKYIKIS